MRPYLALIRIDLKLALRDRSVLFFNYLFPLIFFFAFAEMMGATRGAGITNVVTMVLTLGILGNGLWGAGMRAVQEREMNILRRFKVTPISPAPILIASMVTGWLMYLPSVVIVCSLAHRLYGMPIPGNWFSLLGLVTMGVFAFRSIGLILASIVNSTQESTIGIQILYMPMLFLSGATFPTVMLPAWAQIVGQFLPATYLVTGFQSVFLRRESLAQNWPAVAALLATMALATFISMQIFRWEKEEKLRPAAKLWVLAVLSPFVVMGCYQAYSKDHKQKAALLWRELMRNDTFVIRGAKIFVGSGEVIESGAVLVKEGKIAGVYTGAGPETKADVVEGAGKTLLPGLIDAHVHLGSPGGTYESPQEYARPDAMRRALAAYLYSGVTAVRSVGDFLDMSLEARSAVESGKRVGAELVLCGPMFTAEDGHGTEYIQYMPEFLKARAREQMVRIPKTPGEARQQVRALKQAGADCVKAILDAGLLGKLPRLDTALLMAIGEEARAQNLPLLVHTGNASDVEDALDAGAAGIEHGARTEEIPERLFTRMAHGGVTYDPTLSPLNVMLQDVSGKLKLLDRSLVQQAGPKSLIESTRRALQKERQREKFVEWSDDFDWPNKNLLRAHRAGVTLITGSDAGNPLVIHGPTVQQELALWVKAGIPAAVALQAATYNAAKSLRMADRIGTIEVGRDANLLLVDGDPLSDISATERISLVIYKGERIRNRGWLLDQK